MNRYTQMNRNELQVFEQLQRNPALTSKSLLLALDLKSGILNRALNSLCDDNIIEEIGFDSSTGGRKPIIYSINTNNSLIIGVDISASRIRTVICDLTMHIICSKESFLMLNVTSLSSTVSILKDDIEFLLNSSDISPDKILCMGVGMLGPYNIKTGKTLNMHVGAHSSWSSADIRSTIVSSFAWPVFIDLGINSAVFYEYYYGQGRGHKSVSYIECEVSIRSGYITSGTIVQNENGIDDTFAHTTINSTGERCDCGRRGCVKGYASTLAISNDLRKRIRAGEKTLMDVSPEDIHYKAFTDAEKQGDGLTIDTLTQAGSYFGIALSNYIMLLNPEAVIIGGPLPILSDSFFNSALSVVKSELHTISPGNTVFFRGGYASEFTIAVGSAALACSKFIRKEAF